MLPARYWQHIQTLGLAALIYAATMAIMAGYTEVDLMKLAKSLRCDRNQPRSMQYTDLYTKFVNHPDLFQSYTNLSPSEFSELLNRIPCSSQHGRPREVTKETQYMLVLNFLKTGKTLVDYLGEIGTSTGTAKTD